MTLRDRSFWLAAALLGYGAFAALSVGATPLRLGFVGAAVTLLLAGFYFSAPPVRGEDPIGDSTRRAARGATTGAALFLATTGVASGGPLILQNLGAAIAAVFGLVAVARLPTIGGLAHAEADALRLDFAGLVALLWTVAILLPMAEVLAPEQAAGMPPDIGRITTTAASIGSLLTLVAATWRARTTRRLQLGAFERAHASLVFVLAVLFGAVAAAALRVAPAEQALPAMVSLAALFTASAAAAPNAARLVRGLRLALGLGFAGLPIALGATYLSRRYPSTAPQAAFFGAALAALAALLAIRIAKRLSPERGAWIDAIDAATDAAMHPDPDQALESALTRLSAAQDAAFTSPWLYRIAAADVVSVDRAGFIHETSAELPERLVRLCEEEPEGVLRTEVLRSVEVRRADLRPLLAWLEERKLTVIATVRDSTGPIGALALEGGRRSTLLNVEEVRGLRTLADRLGAVLGVSASLARARKGEIEARERVERAEARATDLTEALGLEGARQDTWLAQLERETLTSAYSPAARVTAEQIERLAASTYAFTLVAPPGVRSLPWAAYAHRRSPRSSAAMVVASGTDRELAELSRWRDDARSPLALARYGTLLLIDPQALPRTIQDFIAAVLPPDQGCFIIAGQTIDALAGQGLVTDRFADRVGDTAVVLPTLEQRAEDLHAIALARLSAIGIRSRGRPYGLAPDALAALGELEFEGGDDELDSVLHRAVRQCQGDTITQADIQGAVQRPSHPGEPARGANKRLSRVRGTPRR